MNRCVLLSGGIDSIAMLFWLKPDIAITIDYGQHAANAETSASRQACNAVGVPHMVIKANCSEVGFGSMSPGGHTTSCGDVALPPSPEWWPYRNQLLVTLAAAKAVVLGVKTLFIGTVTSDSVHKDGSTQFVETMNALLSLQEGNLSLAAPGIAMTSVELVRESGVPLPVLAWAHSCHRSNVACGECRGCWKYRDVMRALFPDGCG